MFRHRSLALGLFLLLSAAGWAQPPSEPLDLGVVLRKSGASFQPLELQRALKQDRAPLFSLSISQVLVVAGPRSPVRFSAGQPIEFFMRVFLNDSDPRAAFFPMRDPTKFSLIQLNVDGEERQITLTETGLTYTDRRTGRPLLVRLYGEHSFQLTPSEALPPGEYAIKYQSEESDKFDLFCFGIDPKD